MGKQRVKKCLTVTVLVCALCVVAGCFFLQNPSYADDNIDADMILITGAEHDEIYPGDSFTLTAEIEPSDATDQSITWTSFNDKIATVSASGKVTAVSAGRVMITATTANGLSDPYHLVVWPQTRQFTVSVNTYCDDYNSVGNDDWREWFKVNNGEWFTFTAEAYLTRDSYIKVNNYIGQYDNDPDIGTSSVSHYVTQSEYNEGFTVTSSVYVYENRGRFAGNRCKWTIEYEFTPVENGWYKSGSNWFYITDGNMTIGDKTIDDVAYYFDENGRLQTGWVQKGEDWFYYTSSGLVTGWKKSGGAWYYLDETSGKMKTGLLSIEGKNYCFDDEGKMGTGWTQVNSDWYYCTGSGDVTVGWKQVGGKWYYFDDAGAMLTGKQLIDEENYFFNDNGAMQTGWQQENEDWYFYDSDGSMVRNDWHKSGGYWYYFDRHGVMVVNKTMTIDGKSYSFDEKGHMSKE